MADPAILSTHDALCQELEKKYGPRFKVPKLLAEMATKGDTFYGRFAPAPANAA